jgi:predicted RNase H-like HicB family nuclease
MIYDIYFQVNRTGRTHAHVPAWPGCNWLANDPEEALGSAAGAIAWHLSWLSKYGKLCPLPGEPIVPRLAQQHSSTAREGNLIGFFEFERQPVLAEEVPYFLELMTCARVELLELTRDLPGEILVWQPAPGSWSIQEALRHVASAERWYLTRILDPSTLPKFKPNPSVWRRLEVVRELVLERLSGLNEAERSKVIPDASCELWSARKVFRRYLEHEREHTRHVQEIQAQYAASR